MDRMLYMAMNGARQNMLAQAVNTNNLANVSTTGFRADLEQFRSMPMFGPGHASRVYAMAEKPGADFTPGPINTTGRDLDIAVQGKGWIAVQANDGTEAYTRAGNLQISPNGLLTNSQGLPVIGDGGAITLPPAAKIHFSQDGSVAVVPLGDEAAAPQILARIKLVNPENADLVKGTDGLMRLRDGEEADADADVRLVPGALEGSNVQVADALAKMIDLSRQFEMQVKMMKTAERNADQTMQLLRLA
ncbi:MAG: flagellar basal-body rod protein FlgF [Gammaproteobacteria bacterium]